MSFSVRHLRFEISFPLAALMTAVILFDSSLSVIVCFASVLLHESGHLLALGHYGCFPETVRLTLFDIAIIDRNKTIRSNKAELIITLAGVTVNFLTAGIAYWLFCMTPSPILEMLYMTNLSLGLFNSLPVDSLDGGQALLILFSHFLSPYHAVKLLDILSFMILVPTAVMGFLVLLRSGYNFTLLLTAMYLMALLLLKNKK